MGDVVMPAARQVRFRISFRQPRAQVLFKRHDETEAGRVTSAEDAAIRHLEAELVAQAIHDSPDVQHRVSIT